MLNPSPDFVVRAYLHAWREPDFERTLDYMHDDIEWHMYIDSSVISFAGATVGIDAMRKRIIELRRSWELLAHSFENMELIGQTVRVMMYADYKHITTGRILDLKMRGVFRVVGKQIVRCDEYHDELRIRAFMALVAADSQGREG